MKSILLVTALVTAFVSGAEAQRSNPREVVLATVLESNPLRSDHHRRLSDEILRGHVGAHLLTVFVIDTLGRIETGSVRFVREAPEQFRRYVCGELNDVHFRPIRRDTQARRAMIVRPFDFWPKGDTAFHVTGGARFDSTRAAIAAKGVVNTLHELTAKPGCS